MNCNNLSGSRLPVKGGWMEAGRCDVVASLQSNNVVIKRGEAAGGPGTVWGSGWTPGRVNSDSQLLFLHLCLCHDSCSVLSGGRNLGLDASLVSSSGGFWSVQFWKKITFWIMIVIHWSAKSVVYHWSRFEATVSFIFLWCLVERIFTISGKNYKNINIFLMFCFCFVYMRAKWNYTNVIINQSIC